MPPIGQHAFHLTYDQGLMVFDNGNEQRLPSTLPACKGPMHRLENIKLNLTKR